MAWALVTPSSRGIGHALTRRLLLSTPASLPIVATSRPHNLSETRDSLLSSVPSSTQAERRLDVQPCDLTSEDSIAQLSRYCRDRYNNHDDDPTAHLRLAFCVPGMLGRAERAPDQLDADLAMDTLRLNLIAPMLLAKHFVGFLPTKKLVRKIAEKEQNQDQAHSSTKNNNNSNNDNKNQQLPPLPTLPTTTTALLSYMSARVGSITDNSLGGWYSYRSSKAGLNQLIRSLNIHIDRVSGGAAACVGLHPGTVRTGLSKPFWDGVPKGKLFEPDDAAQRLWDVVVGTVLATRAREGEGETGKVGGRCWDWKGDEVPP